MSYHIGIAGSGFTAMVLALALSYRRVPGEGLSVALMDPHFSLGKGERAFPSDDGRAFALTAASMRMLTLLCPKTDLAARAQAVTRMEIYDSELDEAVRIPLLSFETDKGSAEGGASAFILQNGILEEALTLALSESSGIDYFPYAISRFETEGQKIKVCLEGGEALHVPLLIGADGANSAIAARAGVKVRRYETGQSGLTGLLSLGRGHEGRAVQYFLPDGPCALLPLPGDYASLIWTEKTDRVGALMGLPAPFLEKELKRRLSYEFSDARLVSPLQSWPIFFQMAHDFTGKRLALVGDAAHVTHPLAGQGFNLALKDIAALTECIVDAVRLGLDIGSPFVLDRYQRWRRFDSLTMLATTNLTHSLFLNQNSMVCFLRDFGLGVLEKLPSLKNLMVLEASGDTGVLPSLLRGKMP